MNCVIKDVNIYISNQTERDNSDTDVPHSSYYAHVLSGDTRLSRHCRCLQRLDSESVCEHMMLGK